MKFSSKTYSNMLDAMVMSNLSDLDWKYPFWAVLVKKIKVICFN